MNGQALAARVSALLGIAVEHRVSPRDTASLHGVVGGVPRSIHFLQPGDADPVRIAWNWSRT